MIIELTPAYMDKPLFLRLAKDYVEELAQYDSMIRWDEYVWSRAGWDAQLIMEDRTVQGFVITEKVPFDFYAPAFHVEEFYVVPEARRRGLGMAAVKAITERVEEDLFLYILKRNTQAKLFWGAVEEELRWKRIVRPEIIEEEGCELRVYRTGA